MPATRYRQLDDTQIVTTLVALQSRIEARFPGSGLGRLTGELLALSREAADCVAYLRRPHWPIRVAVGVAIATMLAMLALVVFTVRVPTRIEGLAEFVQAIESGINDVVFLGLAIFFLLTVEGRIKRRRALASLHELRSVVHIVDMHQLTKDPERLFLAEAPSAEPTPRVMSPPELGRYLDYCTELLSLASKIAALFVQHFNDPVVLSAVNEIETLAGGFTGKIWQKITLLDATRIAGARGGTQPASATGGAVVVEP
jgi:hypothetical protein